MTDFVVVKDGQDVAVYKNERTQAERHAAEIDGKVVQRLAPLTGIWATFGKT